MLHSIASFRTIKIFRFHIALVVEYLSGLLTLTLLQFAIDLLLSFGLAQGTCHIQELVVAQLLAMQSNDGGQRRLWILKGDKSKAARTSLLIEHKLQIKNHKHHSVALAGQTPRSTPHHHLRGTSMRNVDNRSSMHNQRENAQECAAITACRERQLNGT